MKVILTGSHGVGKTTLIDSLRDDYKDIIIPEQIRILAERFPSLQHSQNASFIEQDMFFNAYEREFSIRNHYIADRGLIDIFAYTCQLPLICKSNYGLRASLYTISKQKRELETFSEENQDIHYVYIPIEFSIENDEFRDVDENYQKTIDSSIRSLIQTYCKDVTIITGSKRERSEKFRQMIDYWWDSDKA